MRRNGAEEERSSKHHNASHQRSTFQHSSQSNVIDPFCNYFGEYLIQQYVCVVGAYRLKLLGMILVMTVVELAAVKNADVPGQMGDEAIYDDSQSHFCYFPTRLLKHGTRRQDLMTQDGQVRSNDSTVRMIAVQILS
eukprot:678618-Amphidinium_carterae.2